MTDKASSKWQHLINTSEHVIVGGEIHITRATGDIYRGLVKDIRLVEGILLIGTHWVSVQLANTHPVRWRYWSRGYYTFIYDVREVNQQPTISHPARNADGNIWFGHQDPGGHSDVVLLLRTEMQSTGRPFVP